MKPDEELRERIAIFEHNKHRRPDVIVMGESFYKKLLTHVSENLMCFPKNAQPKFYAGIKIRITTDIEYL